MRCASPSVSNGPSSVSRASQRSRRGRRHGRRRAQRTQQFHPDRSGRHAGRQGRPILTSEPARSGSSSAVSSGVKLAAFPQYYRGRPPLAGIDVSNYPTQRNAWTALMRGDIDMLYEVSREADGLRASGVGRSRRTPSRGRTTSRSSSTSGAAPLRDARVRQAINDAIDRATLVRDGMRGHGSVADGPVWPQHWAYTAPPKPFGYDPDAAAALLDAAGVPPPGDTAVPGAGSPVVYLPGLRQRLALRAAWRSSCRKQLAEVGIEMQLRAVAAR